MTFFPFSFADSWLTESNEAHVVIAQVTPPSPEIMKADCSRPWVVELMTQLLGAKEGLKQIVSGTKPSILILPELALGFCDWQKIDQLVRGWSRPLILISGFGFTKGKLFRGWLEEKSQTVKSAAWSAQDGPSDDRVYNGGWCWVRRGDGSTSCIAFLKATAEQHNEVQIEGLDQIAANLSVELRDLIIFPVICSDFLWMNKGQRYVEHKIRSYLAEKEDNQRPVLIAGLLLQPAASDKWRNAIHDVARSINTDRVNVCLVNSAWNILAHREDIDRWRAYSGLYIAKGRKPFPDQFPAVRRFTSEQIDGAVLRTTLSSVAGGPLRWAFDGATGRHLWRVHKAYSVNSAGELEDLDCIDRFQFELLRLLGRFTEAKDAPAEYRTELAKASYQIVKDRVLASPAEAEPLCKKTLFGDLKEESAKTLTADTLSDHLIQAASGLRVLGALESQTDLSWEDDASRKGQLTLVAKGIGVLVWHSPESAVSVRQAIMRWKTEFTDRPLVIFKKATGTLHLPSSPISERRRDVSEAPPSGERSMAEARQISRVTLRDLDELEHCLGESSPANFKSSVKAVLAASLEQLAGEFSL